MIKPRKVNVKLLLRFSAVVGLFCTIIYPIIISPICDPEPFKNIQTLTRKNINQDQVQPGNMKVWSDPFNRKKSSDESSGK